MIPRLFHPYHHNSCCRSCKKTSDNPHDMGSFNVLRSAKSGSGEGSATCNVITHAPGHNWLASRSRIPAIMSGGKHVDAMYITSHPTQSDLRISSWKTEMLEGRGIQKFGNTLSSPRGGSAPDRRIRNPRRREAHALRNGNDNSPSRKRTRTSSSLAKTATTSSSSATTAMPQATGSRLKVALVATSWALHISSRAASVDRAR